MGRGEKILLVPFSFELHACGVGVGFLYFCFLNKVLGRSLYRRMLTAVVIT